MVAWRKKRGDKRVLVIKIIAILVNIFIYILSIFCIIGGVQSIMTLPIPSNEDFHWDVVDDELHLTVDAELNNGGTFEITDLNAELSFTDKNSSFVFAEDSVKVNRIGPGETKNFQIKSTFKFTELESVPGRNLIFENSTSEIVLDVAAKYTLGLTDIHIQLNFEGEWEPIITPAKFEYREENDISVPNIDANWNNDALTFEIPLNLQVRKWFNQPVEVEGKVTRFDGTVYGNNTILIDLSDVSDPEPDNDFNGENGDGDEDEEEETRSIDEKMIIPISELNSHKLLTSSEDLTFTLTTKILAGRYSYLDTLNYHWGAPFEDLTISAPTNNSANIMLTNNYQKELDLEVQIFVYDEFGDELGWNLIQYHIGQYQYFDEIITAEIEGNPDHIIVQLYDARSGFSKDQRLEVS